MIRTSHPVSPMKHLRLRLELATRQTRRTLEKRRRTLLIEMSGTERLKTANTGDVYLLLRWREDVRRQRSIYDAFYDQYDGMIGLLCTAAQVGIEARMEEEYLRRQAWFAANYPQRVQSLVAPYLIGGPKASVMDAAGFGLAVDPFEDLYLPVTIEAMLKSDAGNIIERMTHTLETLEAWEGHIVRQEKALIDWFRFN